MSGGPPSHYRRSGWLRSPARPPRANTSAPVRTLLPRWPLRSWSATRCWDPDSQSGWWLGCATPLALASSPQARGAWRVGGSTGVALTLFGMHGVLLSFGFGMFPLLVVGWVLLGVSGAWLAVAFSRE